MKNPQKIVGKNDNPASKVGTRLAVDIGGTFTDVALVDETSGRIGIAKVPTTPRDFGKGVVQGLSIALHTCPRFRP